MYTVSSDAISTSKYRETTPVIDHRVVDLDPGRYRRQIEFFEYYWGLQKGELDMDSPLNHIKLRSDMAARLRNREWVFMPTSETLRVMQQIADYNKVAGVLPRKNCLKVNREYEYDFVPLLMTKKGRPTLYVDHANGFKAMRAPYKLMHRIRSCAHPFFVAFMANTTLHMMAPIVMPMDKARPLMRLVGNIVRTWLREPPAEFLIGPDVWNTHRHPLSDDGNDARTDITNPPKNYTPPLTRSRKTTRAPCHQPKSIAKAKPYDRSNPIPHRDRGSALPRPGLQSGKGAGSAHSDVVAWVDSVRRPAKRATPSWPPASLEDEEAKDAELAHYRLEKARDVANALDPHTNIFYNTGLIYGMGVDWSGLSSNNWAIAPLFFTTSRDDLPPYADLNRPHYQHLQDIVNYRIVDLNPSEYRRQVSLTSMRMHSHGLMTPVQIEHFEYYWGLQRCTLDLSSPMNHMQLRKDMVEGLKNLDWVIMPTKDTLDTMYQLAKFNETADLESRKNCLKVSPLMYTRNSRNKTWMASEQLDLCACLVMPEKKGRALMDSVGRIIRCWMRTPPDEFLIGPDVWKPHRHPLSDDGEEARAALSSSPKANVAPRRQTRRGTRAPCSQSKTSTRAKPYELRDRQPIRSRGSALPRPGRISGDDSGDFDAAYISAWMANVPDQSVLVSPSRPSTPRSEDSGDDNDEPDRLSPDDALACYREEVARESEDALDPGINVSRPSGLKLGHGGDWSRFASNNWAALQNNPIVNHRIIDLDAGQYRRQIEYLEYYWGMEKGDLILDSQMNHIEHTLNSMYELAQYNATAPLEARKCFLDAFPVKEYEYDVVPLRMLTKKRATLYAHRGAHLRAFQAPFENLPRIKSRAHPFFVILMASERLDATAICVMPTDRAKLLIRAAGRIVDQWSDEPPSAFLVGRDVWKQHRHPLSDDGHEARTASGNSRAVNFSPMRLRRSTRAPCCQQKVATSSKPYTRYDFRPAHARGSALSRPGLEFGEEDARVIYDIADIRAWVDKIERRRAASTWPANWIDKEAADDDMLARYRRESVRDADDALHPQTTYNGGGIILVVSQDHSRFSSNHWAMRASETCLWTLGNPQDEIDRPL
ncbi:hypothetical protein K525DRAFT_284689 [Schizophyllum commune Loenen D]|nr:hypothetical protein K525DRAFT_284689 [Schizophyllum commune Loenen D]